MGSIRLRKLPVLAINIQALLFVWERRRALLQALIATSVLFAMGDIANHFLRETHAWASVFINQVVLAWGVFTLFAVTCHRIVLLGEASVPKYGLLSWTRRETRFLGWLLVSCLYALGIIIPLALLYVAIGMVKPDFIHGHEKYAAVLGALPVIYVVARLAVLFPATAIEERRSTDWAFEITTGNGWRLAFATGLIPGSIGLATSALPFERDLVTTFLAGLLNSVLTAIGVVVLSFSFRFLSTQTNESDTSPPTSRPPPAPT